MMRVLYILRLVKGTSWEEAMSNSEEIKLIAISIVSYCLAEGIS